MKIKLDIVKCVQNGDKPECIYVHILYYHMCVYVGCFCLYLGVFQPMSKFGLWHNHRNRTLSYIEDPLYIVCGRVLCDLLALQNY